MYDILLEVWIAISILENDLEIVIKIINIYLLSSKKKLTPIKIKQPISR